MFEGPTAAPSWPTQYREWCQNVFILARFLFLGRSRNLMVLNLESDVDMDKQATFLFGKNSRIRSEVRSRVVVIATNL